MRKEMIEKVPISQGSKYLDRQIESADRQRKEEDRQIERKCGQIE